MFPGPSSLLMPHSHRLVAPSDSGMTGAWPSVRRILRGATRRARRIELLGGRSGLKSSARSHCYSFRPGTESCQNPVLRCRHRQEQSPSLETRAAPAGPGRLRSSSVTMLSFHDSLSRAPVRGPPGPSRRRWSLGATLSDGRSRRQDQHALTQCITEPIRVLLQRGRATFTITPKTAGS